MFLEEQEKKCLYDPGASRGCKSVAGSNEQHNLLGLRN